MGKNIRHCLQVYTKYRQSAEIWKGQKAALDRQKGRLTSVSTNSTVRTSWTHESDERFWEEEVGWKSTVVGEAPLEESLIVVVVVAWGMEVIS